MSEPHRIVIVGAGLAGATAAITLRKKGYSGDLLLLGAEQHRPYELPALSKSVLLHDTDEPDWVADENYYVKHGIDLRRGVQVTRVELGARTLTDVVGAEHGFDRLLLATGSRPRTLDVPGADLPGIATLRTIDDALDLRAAIEDAQDVLVIGAGWIGCEAAAAARSAGADVTVVEPQPLPLTSLGDDVATVFRDMHADHGVRWRLATSVTGFFGEEQVEGAELSDGSQVAADVVLLAVGAAPRSDLARTAGLELADDGGVDVDAGLRSAAPAIYAAGDVAAHFHPRYGRRIRVEHWANAKWQGEHVAGNLLGEHEPYTATPYFFTDQYDLGCEYRGLADPDLDELVVRGDLARREFIAFWRRAGRVTSAMNVNMWDDVDALRTLVDERAEATAERLRDGDLADLAEAVL
ncbi:MAG: NAD(P)/FAD-dependent oxidoreductase [Actinophytocola sp.]|nr:NAD(P)/FAD-dependent oxidoreductase [Actinophytocola sp.]